METNPKTTYKTTNNQQVRKWDSGRVCPTILMLAAKFYDNMDTNIDPNQLARQNPDDHAGQVALPFTQSQFTNFLVSLLGKPQTITKKFRGAFEINKDTLITLFEILNQRVYQQNDSKLIQFRSTIYYNDNSTVTLNGFDHLVNYNERLPLVSEAVHLTWTFVVKFRDKENYERQEIAVSFLTETNSEIAFDEDTKFNTYQSCVNIRIAHTARTWGADIEGLLSKHIKTIVKPQSKLINFFRYSQTKVEYSFSSILILISLVFSTVSTIRLSATENLQNVSTWIHHYAKIGFLFAGTYVFMKITLLLLEEFEIYEEPSYILLTPESEKAKTSSKKHFKKRLKRYLGTMIGSILLGVVGNFVYDWLTKK